MKARSTVVTPGPGQEPSSQRGHPEPDHPVRGSHTHHRLYGQLAQLSDDLLQLADLTQRKDADQTRQDIRPTVGLEPTARPRPHATRRQTSQLWLLLTIRHDKPSWPPAVTRTRAIRDHRIAWPNHGHEPNTSSAGHRGDRRLCGHCGIKHRGKPSLQRVLLLRMRLRPTCKYCHRPLARSDRPGRPAQVLIVVLLGSQKSTAFTEEFLGQIGTARTQLDFPSQPSVDGCSAASRPSRAGVD